MSKDVKAGITPQGQVVVENRETTAPSMRASQWSWTALLDSPVERYGVYTSPRYIKDQTKLNMLYDPVLSMAVGFTGAALIKATRVIECEDEDKRVFFENLFSIWEEEFMLQANMAIALGSVGLVKKWRFVSPESLGATGNVDPFVIVGFDQCYPLTSYPRFDAKRRVFEGIDTEDGHIDRFYSLWLTIGKEMAFGDYAGWGRLSSAYNDWWTKSMIRDNYIISMQKTASPSVSVSYPPGKEEKSDKDNQAIARAVGDAVQAGSTVAIPSNVYENENEDETKSLSNIRKWSVEFIQPGNSIKNFPELENHHNRLIALAYLLPPQAVMDVTGGDLGGPTSADKLTRLAEELLMQDAAAIDRHINKYVFPDISNANFPSDSPPVTIKTTGLDSASTEHIMELLKIALPEKPALFSVPDALKAINMPVDEEAVEAAKNAPKNETDTSGQEDGKNPVEATGGAIAASSATSMVNPDTGKVEPRGKPLGAPGDDPVEISVNEIAQSVARWYKNADAEARNALLAPTYGEDDA